MPENVRARAARATGALLLTLAFALLYALVFAPEAKAAGQLKGHCEVYDTSRVDPIAFATHDHHQFGNTSTMNESTGDSLFASKGTSCAEPWLTSAAWFPDVANARVPDKIGVYYRAPGDQRQVRALPKGLQLLGNEVQFNCASSNTGNNGAFQDSPTYGCRSGWSIRVSFPDCWNQQSLEETSTVNSRSGVCPSSHPYRIPKVNFLIQWRDSSAPYPNPLMVSAGDGMYMDYTFMHGDYFAATQPEFNEATSKGPSLLDLCLRNVSDSTSLRSLHDRCGANA